jgi:hypothetical protein
MMNDKSNGLGDYYGGTGENSVADADADDDAVNSSTELVMMSGNNNKEGSFHDDEENDDVEEDRQIRDASENKIIIDTENNNADGKTSGTYPADCYSFLALYSPFDHFGFW